MSVRKLEKEFYHAGKDNSRKFEVAKYNKDTRHNANYVCREMTKNPELYDEEVSLEDFDNLVGWEDGKRFRFSLLRRWLDSQVGKPYDEVKSSVFEKFNSKSNDGTLILQYGYLFEEKSRNPGYTPNYIRDENGNFAKSPKTTRRRGPQPDHSESVEFSIFMNGRILFEKDGKYFWRTSTEGEWASFFFWDGIQYFHYTNGYHKVDSQRRYIKNKKEFIGAQGYEKMKSVKCWGYWSDEADKSVGTHCDHWSEVEFPFGFTMISEASPEETEIIKNANPKILQKCMEFYKKRFS